MVEPLYTADEMRAAEAGHDVDQLMARAGRAVAEEAMRRFPQARRFVAVCGGGANGGDGRIAVDVLRSAGRDALVSDDVAGADLIVDALFGTGFHGEPREDAARKIEAINDAGVPVVAVDLPSGVNASTGEIAAACVDATLSVTMHGRKVGLEVAPGRFHAGEVVVADIGLEPAETEHRRVTAEIIERIPRKRPDQNKYSAGTVLVVGGSRGLTGAPCLAAEAAFRADAGYVAVAVPDSTLPVFEQRLLEAVKLGCPEEDGRISPRAIDPIVEFAAKAGAVALGPGLGRGDGPKQVVARLLAELHVPVVVDADGLFALEPFERSGQTVLTPHEGELARLLGGDSEWVAAHRLEAARRGAERFGCVCLLKGADTLIASPGEGTWVCGFGKTSLLRKALDEAERGGELVPVLVDLYGVLSYADVTIRIERAYAQLKGTIRKTIEAILRTTGLGLSLGAPGISVKLQLEPRTDPLPALHALLDLPQRVAERSGTRVLVALDEFQDIAKVQDFDKLLRSHIQHQGESASYIFCGSEPGMMRELFDVKGKPLYGQAEPLKLGRLPDDAIATYIAERFARTKRGADRVLDALLATARGHPQRAMLLAHRLWDEVAAGKAANEDDWQAALARTRNQVAAEFDALWRGLEANEQRALRAIALFPDAPYGARALGAVDLKKSGAHYAVRSLLAKGELEEENGRVVFVDPLFELWLNDVQRGREDAPV